jgi:ribosomal protein S21
VKKQSSCGERTSEKWTEQGEQNLAEVTARPGEPVNDLLRRFKSLVTRQGILGDYKSHRAFASPGEKRREKIRIARRRRIKRARREARERW